MTSAGQGAPRVSVDGKFFRLGKAKFFVKGVAYGPFAPNSAGQPWASADQTTRDFALIRELGANVVPRELIALSRGHEDDRPVIGMFLGGAGLAEGRVHLTGKFGESRVHVGHLLLQATIDLGQGIRPGLGEDLRLTGRRSLRRLLVIEGGAQVGVLELELLDLGFEGSFGHGAILAGRMASSE